GLDPAFGSSRVMPLLGIAVVSPGLAWFLRSPVGEAAAERIRQRTRGRGGVGVGYGGGGGGGGAGGGDDPQRVAALEEQVAQLQSQISELAERLDFAERMLAERRERKLGAGQ